MEINVDKTKFLNFTTKKNITQIDYSLSTIPIEAVTSYKYLGINFNHNLSWEHHINYISAKANKSLGFLKRHLYKATQETKLIADNSLIRPQLEYASIVWNPHQLYLEEKLEAVQNRASRFILRNYHPTSVNAMKAKLNLPLLKHRKKVLRLTHLHKIYYNFPIKKDEYCPPAVHIFPRTDHPFKIQLTTPRTNLFKFSPLQLAITDWNNLPEAIVSITKCNNLRSAISSLDTT